jgi:hypothetical protein
VKHLCNQQEFFKFWAFWRAENTNFITHQTWFTCERKWMKVKGKGDWGDKTLFFLFSWWELFSHNSVMLCRSSGVLRTWTSHLVKVGLQVKESEWKWMKENESEWKSKKYVTKVTHFCSIFLTETQQTSKCDALQKPRCVENMDFTPLQSWFTSERKCETLNGSKKVWRGEWKWKKVTKVRESVNLQSCANQLMMQYITMLSSTSGTNYPVGLFVFWLSCIQVSDSSWGTHSLITLADSQGGACCNLESGKQRRIFLCKRCFKWGETLAGRLPWPTFEGDQAGIMNPAVTCHGSCLCQNFEGTVARNFHPLSSYHQWLWGDLELDRKKAHINCKLNCCLSEIGKMPGISVQWILIWLKKDVKQSLDDVFE